MRARSSTLLLLFGLSLGVAATVGAHRLGAWPAALTPAELRPTQKPTPKPAPKPAPCPTPPPTAAVTPAPIAALPTAPAPAEQPERTSVSVTRFDVCPIDKAMPRLQLLRLTANARPVAAVHCGHEAELIAFDTLGDTLAPRRIARIQLRAPGTDLVLQPGGIHADDVSGDGRPDVIVASYWQDSTGAPRGGSVLELVREESGGFGAPLLLSSVAARASGALQLDSVAGADLAIASLEDARVGRKSELVLMHGGPAPLKLATLSVGSDVRALTTLDLDEDGHDDLVVAAAAPVLELLFLAPDGSVRERRSVETGECRQLERVDLDGDGHDDVLIAGSTLSVLLAAHGNPSAPRAIPVSEPVRQVFPIDLNADGKLDLLVLTPSHVLLLQQADELRFVPQAIAALPPAPLSVLDIAALSSDVDGHFALVLLVLGPDGKSVQLSIVPIEQAATADWREAATPLRDAPLSLQLQSR